MPPPPMDRRRRYWPSQTERADAKHICSCPAARRFSSFAEKMRADRARLAGCCCTQPVAHLYVDVPRVQDGLPCSTVEEIVG
jgi:hypothetical protein